MPHKVEISDKTFEKLKEYCSINDLKIGQYADKLIFDGLMIDMYGDVPFTNYKKVPQEMVEIPVPEKLKEQEPIPEEIQEVIDNHFFEMLGDEKEKQTGPTEEFVKEWDEVEKWAEEQNKTLKQAGVPTKVVNKITKRRLK